MTPRPIRKLADNSKGTAKKRARGKPFAEGEDPRRNLNGAPKRGQSWREIFDEIGNMTGPEVAKIAGEMGREFSKLPDGVTLKVLTAMRVYGQMINEPSPGLLSAVMDRAEGKPVQPISGPSNDDADKFSGIKLQLISRLSKIATEPEAADIPEQPQPD